ncbi:MAG: Helix-turn-helix domain protein [Pelotomaculum sp. PtaB.Bin104]|nr:MAG: Helix-turn-helix domain protein [Pelotomaculum sp. PtaB.Bin104]
MSKLKEILKARGLSQGKVSRMADVPASNFCLICNDKGYAPPAWRHRIAEALELPEAEIFPEYANRKDLREVKNG